MPLTNYRRMQLVTKLATEMIKTAAPVAGGPIARGVTAVASAPLKFVGDMVGSALLGAKAKAGPMAGKRLRHAGIEQIEDSVAKKLIKDKKGNIVRQLTDANGNKTWVKDKYRPGGLVGTAMKHPLGTALGSGGVYMVGGMLSEAKKKRLMKQQEEQQEGYVSPNQNIQTGAWV